MQGIVEHQLSVGMISLPGGNIQFIHPHLSQKIQPLQQDCITSLWPKEKQDEIELLLKELAQDTKLSLKTIDHQALSLEFSVRPVFDGESLCALLWYTDLPRDTLVYDQDLLFHRSVIPSWVVDVTDINAYFTYLNLKTHQDIDQRLAEAPDFLPTILNLVQINEMNAALVRVFDQSSDRVSFKTEFKTYLSEQDICHLSHAVISINQKSTRYAYFGSFKSADRSYWINAEVPALGDIAEGILFSAVDMTPVNLADTVLNDQEQFLSTVVSTLPDYLMLYDNLAGNLVLSKEEGQHALHFIFDEIEHRQKNLVHQFDQPQALLSGVDTDKMQKDMQENKFFVCKIKAIDRINKERHFTLRFAPLDKDRSDHILSAIVVATEITAFVKAEEKLLKNQKRNALLANNFSDLIITLNADFSVNYVSRSSETLLGYSSETFLSKAKAFSVLGLSRFESLLKNKLADALQVSDDKNKTHQKDSVFETAGIRSNGQTVPLEIKVSYILNPQREVEGLLIVGRDITERRAVEAHRHLAMQVFDNSLDGIYITGKEGRIVQANKAFVTITGYNLDQVTGEKPSMLSSGWHETSFKNDIFPIIKNKKYWEGEILSRRANGEAFQAQVRITALYDTDKEYLGLITSFKDVTEAKNSEENIKKLAYYDPLTNLPNRSLFNDRLEQALQRGNRNRLYVAILFIDLDGFKAINDSLGHANGDRLLTEVGARLTNTLRSDDTVARMGGDEFNIILNSLHDRDVAETATAQIASKIVKRLAEPFVIQGHPIRIGCSIGIALYPDDSINAEELIKQADTAMYHAKQLGKNGFQFYTTDLYEKAQERNKLEDDLLATKIEDEFTLVFQPKYTLDKQRALVGFEALIRWHHPTRGLIKPNTFLTTAEELGLSIDLGEWVINEACRQLSEWHITHDAQHTMSVNVFERHYREGDLVGSVKDCLTKYTVLPERLSLEISQEILMKDMGYAYALLTELSAIGVRISVDGFGSSLLSLQSFNRLPVDEVKINRQLIKHMNTKEEDWRLVNGIIGIAFNFGYEIVAEGVETEKQLNRLKESFSETSSVCYFNQSLPEGDLSFYVAHDKPVFKK